MQKITIIVCFLLCAAGTFAQSETKHDTLHGDDTSRHKNFGGFMLDMGAMFEPTLFMLPPSLNFQLPDKLDAPGLVLNPDAVSLSPVTYTSAASLSPYSFYSLLYPDAMGGNVTLQGATFRLKNGMRMTTYGEYDADGYKRANPSALPWEKNNFNAAFELKSPNGKFGIRMEVKTGRNYPY